MKKHDIFLYIDMSLLFSWKVQNSLIETDRQTDGDEGHGHRLARDCYIDIFLTHADYIQCPT